MTNYKVPFFTLLTLVVLGLGFYAWNQYEPAKKTVVAATPTRINNSSAPASAPAEDNSPIRAANLGPWAPDGQGENFEVTANETISAGVHLQVWFPKGTSLHGCGNREIHTYVEPGLSVEIQNGGGRGFDYPSRASSGFVRGQIIDDMDRREGDTAFCGWIPIDELIKAGNAIVRFDRRTGNSFPISIPASYKP